MKPQLSVLVIALLNTQLSHANMFNQPDEMSTNTYHSRLTGQLLSGGEQQLGGFGDAMIPVLQNQKNLLFADGTVMIGQELRSTVSGGLGYRGIKQAGLGQGILGAYLFSDYYQTRLKNNYWQLNPGLEWLNERYEARLQGYIPLSQRNQTYRHTYADDIPERVLRDSGKHNYLGGAIGHSLINTPVNLLEEFGPGIELEAGRFFDYGKGFWVRVGGYHFSYNHAKNVNGAEANIEAFINDHMSLLLQNNYDNQNKNRFAIGLRVNFGGSSAPPHSLEGRMTTPIIRHLARQSYGDALPTRRSFQANGPTTVLFNNIWFFSPDGTLPLGAATTLANCTAEHPCSTIDTPTAAQIALLAPDAELFFETGEYNILPNASNQNRWVNLQDGQSFFGRNTGWITAATGNNRPLINGSLIWGSTDPVIASGAVYNMRVNNTNQLIPANQFSLNNYVLGMTNDSVVTLGATGSLTVENSDIQATNNNDNVSALAIVATNNLFINNTTVNAINQGNANSLLAFAKSYGIVTSNNATISGATINAQTSGIANAFGSSAQVTAIVANNELTLSSSTVNALSSGDSSNGGNNVVFAVASNNATVTGLTLTTTSIGAATNGSSNLLFALRANNNLMLSNSTINAISTGYASNDSINAVQGVLADNNLTVSNSTINVLSTGYANTGSINSVAGALAFNNMTLTGTTINAQSSGNVDGFGSNNSAFAIQNVNQTVTVTNSIINALTSGNATNGGINSAFGIAANNVILTGTTVNAQNTGTIDGFSVAGALGVFTSDQVLFQGNTASFITTISPNGAQPVLAFNLYNNSTPLSQCSTDGINFSPCA